MSDWWEDFRYKEDIEELLQRARNCIKVWILCVAISFVFPASLLQYPPELPHFSSFSLHYIKLPRFLLTAVRRDLVGNQVELIAGSWMAGFGVFSLIAMMAGTVFALPYLLYQFYAYLKPALYKTEAKIGVVFILSFLSLFSFGLALTYFFILPKTLDILIYFSQRSGAKPTFLISDFYSFLFTMLFVNGITFTFPCFAYLLTKARILHSALLKGQLKRVTAGILIFTAVFTPDPTPVTMTIWSIPLILLYLLTIKIVEVVEQST